MPEQWRGKWWTSWAAALISGVMVSLISAGAYGAYVAISDHNTIQADHKRLDAIENILPQMQTDIQVICWTVADGKGCSHAGNNADGR